MAKQNGETTKITIDTKMDDIPINSINTPGYGTPDNKQPIEKGDVADLNSNPKKENELTGILDGDSEKLINKEEDSEKSESAKFSTADIIILASMSTALIFANISVTIEAPFFPLAVGISL